jgi:hypothetical protein
MESDLLHGHRHTLSKSTPRKIDELVKQSKNPKLLSWNTISQSNGNGKSIVYGNLYTKTIRKLCITYGGCTESHEEINSTMTRTYEQEDTTSQ